MSYIPEMPNWPCGDYGDAGGLLDHYQTVAKLAVQTLKNVAVYAREEHDGMTYSELASYAEGVIDTINKSGFRP